jgi:hypothetical protein
MLNLHQTLIYKIQLLYCIKCSIYMHSYGAQGIHLISEKSLFLWIVLYEMSTPKLV